MKLYEIASLSLGSDKKWAITYFGTITEQGGNRFGRGQVFFESVESALEFMKYQVLTNTEEYEKIVKDKK